MTDLDEKMKSVRKILNFNSKIIVCGLTNNKISRKEINEIKQECFKIKDMYPFDLVASDEKFFKQIKDFSNIDFVK